MKNMPISEHMQTAIEEALRGMNKNEGGPFGAVIVKDGKIIAKGHNEVLKTNDPTAHAEIVAIRRATARLKRRHLEDCEIYTTCEPCPMCFSAIHWARIKKAYCGCTAKDAADIGFDDKLIYDTIRGSKKRSVKMVKAGRRECLAAFEIWKNKKDKKRY